MFLGTEEEINRILMQLESRKFPFAKYMFSRDDHGPVMLGKGGSARVYEVRRRDHGNRRYALKVIGLGEKRVDYDLFKQAVRGQKDIGALMEEHIVQLYGHVELLVQLDEGKNVVRVEKSAGGEAGADCLRLQFILMEKLEVVLTHMRNGKPALFPEALAQYDEHEILKLAYDIAKALAVAHERGILHRDVKPENIFYSQKTKSYKLGDFGIVKHIKDGMAETAVFTEGYGAPEVVSSVREKYDETADIYSFGMLLYVLLNRLRFPGAEAYHINRAEQYREGYIVPRPEFGSDGLCRMVERMCRYDPDERYQSMKEVLQDLAELIYGPVIGFQKRHRRAPLAVGAVFFAAGAALWKYAETYRWASVSLLLLAVVLLLSSMVLYLDNDVLTRLYFKEQRFWMLAFGFFVSLFGLGMALNLSEFLIGPELQRVGLVCAAFSILWMVRNRVLTCKL